MSDSEEFPYFRYPNFYVDELGEFLTPVESTVLTHVSREILGWRTRHTTKTARIALSVLLHGKTDTRTGQKVYGGVNLARGTLIKTLNTLHHYRILQKTGQPNDPRGQQYTLLDRDQIDWDGLQARKAEMDRKQKQRIRKARETQLQGQARSVRQDEHPISSETQGKHRSRPVGQNEIGTRPVGQNEQRQKLVLSDRTSNGKSSSCRTGTKKERREKEKRERERKDLSLALFFQIFPEVVLNDVQQDAIRTTVQDLSRWKSVLRIWRLQNWQADKVGNLLDRYLHHTDENGNGNGNGVGTTDVLAWFHSLPQDEQTHIEHDIMARYAGLQTVWVDPAVRRKHTLFQRALAEEYTRRACPNTQKKLDVPKEGDVL